MVVSYTKDTAARRRGRIFFSLCLPALVLALFALPDTILAAAAPKGGNTRIVSEKMVYDSAKQQVVFDGNVHVTRPNMEIWSDKLVMILESSGKKPANETSALGMQGGKVERIIAESNVRIQQENKVGTCGRATYLVNQGKIVMEQSPLIVDGDNRIRGRVINYFTESGRSEVIGDVDVRFTTDDAKGPQLPGAPSAAQDDAAPAPPAGGPQNVRTAQ